MKKIISILTFVLLVVGFSSCDIERLPKHAIDADQSLQSVSDAQKWDVGFMANFRTKHRGIYDVIQDIQGDQLNASNDFGNNGGSYHGWISFTASEYDTRDVWIGYYQALKNINKVLSEDIPTKDDAEVAKLNIIKGHGHFLRAFYYFNLSLRFGRPYNSATASQDLAVPMVLTYDPVALPTRATNKELYDQILNVDLKKAKELLSGVKGVPGSSDITYDACLALEARIKLFMSDYSGALAAAETLIGTNTYKLISPSFENMKKMWINDGSSEEIMQIKIQKPDELPNTYTSYYGANTITNANNPRFYPSKWMIDLYSDNDLRKNVYFEKVTINIADDIYKGVYVVSKFKGNPAYKDKDVDNWGGYVPNGIHAPKVFRIAEMYLIAAESAIETNNSVKAATYLNALRQSRGLSAITNITKQDVRDERTRELAFEGFRLWDLRRWNLPMQRREPQTVDGKTEFLSTQFNLNFRIEAGNNKFVWGIPQNDINTNPNLKGQQNPGW